jgi:hypothetical protein
MVRVRAVKTGTIRIRPSHRAGDMSLPVWRRRLAILVDRDWTQPLPIYTYLIEHEDGLFLLDSGECARSAAGGWFPWWNPFFRLAVDIHVEPEDEIGPRLRSIGVDPSRDLRALVLSHLHHDHADGLSHFRGTDILRFAGELPSLARAQGRHTRRCSIAVALMVRASPGGADGAACRILRPVAAPDIRRLCLRCTHTRAYAGTPVAGRTIGRGELLPRRRCHLRRAATQAADRGWTLGRSARVPGHPGPHRGVRPLGAYGTAPGPRPPRRTPPRRAHHADRLTRDPLSARPRGNRHDSAPSPGIAPWISVTYRYTTDKITKNSVPAPTGHPSLNELVHD